MAITVGVIGCGHISQFHFSGLAKAGARVKWVCDLDEALARPWAERTGARATRDHQTVLADPDVEAVTITVPSHFHKDLCLAAIAAGKAVICEKTLTTHPDDALTVVQAAAQADTILYTSYMKRFMPAVAKAKELSPQLGRTFSTWIRSYQPWGPLWTVPATEGIFHQPAGGTSPIVQKSGGGILICGGSHTLDLLHFFCGRPTRVFATQHIPAHADYDLQAAALFDTPSGPAHFEACAHPLARIGFQKDGWDERIEINGTDGRLDIYISMWDQVDTKTGLLVHYDNRTRTATEYRLDIESPFDRAVQFFCQNIERGEQGDQARDTGYVVDELIAAVDQSARAGKAVDILYRD